MKHLPRVLVLLGLGALVLLAEDFWLKKPYAEWGEKDAARILKNSPWTHEVSVGSSSGSPMSSQGGGRGSRGNGQGMGVPDANGSIGGDTGGSGTGGSGMGGSDMGGGGSRGGRGGGSEMGGRGSGIQSMLVRVCWESALPVRQALVVAKFGPEKAASEEAKKFLAQEMPVYVVEVLDLPPDMARFPPERLNEMAKTTTSLRIKDKDPIPASGVQSAKRDKFVDLYFLFPKTSPILLEDKEVEFVSAFGRFEIKKKFKLKDMVIGDKLEL
jgi:hypothetical protein